MKASLLAVLAAALFILPARAQDSAKEKGLAAINENMVEAQLEFLASDWTEGRETGTKGAYMASDYIASMFEFLGLEPGGDTPPPARRRRGEPPPPPPERTYFQNFDLVEYWSGDVQELSVVSKNGDAVKSVDFNYLTDFEISTGRGVQTDMAGEVPVVFVGYGLREEAKGYDDLNGLDLEGKIVIMLRGFPGHKNPGSKTYEKFKPEETRARINSLPESGTISRRSGGNRYSWIAEKGVLAVIQYNPNSNPAAAWSNNDHFFEAEVNGPGRRTWNKMSIPGNSVNSAVSFTVTNRVINEIMNGLDVDFDELERKIDETGKPASMELPGKYVKFKTTVNSRIVKVRNVVGILEGKKKDECIVLGAHYDHMGISGNFIFNGSDDNASGTVGIMTIAKAFTESGKQPEYTLVFCAWTGEEKGLRGSAYFADNPVISDIKCYMNYDMISRVALDDPNENKCDFKYTTAYPVFKELTETHIEKYNINLDMAYEDQEVPRGGSDFSSFSAKGVPIFLLHGKFTPDYHEYTDHSDKANIPYMTDIIRTGYLNLFELANNYQW